MSSIMHRSWADHTGLNWPAHIAAIVNGEVVTWEDVGRNKRERQSKRLAMKRQPFGTIRRPAVVWTFFVPGVIYGGWHLYLRTLKSSFWIHRENELVRQLMAAFPCGLIPEFADFDSWKKEFAKSFPHPTKNKQGISYGWVEQRGEQMQPTRFWN